MISTPRAELKSRPPSRGEAATELMETLPNPTDNGKPALDIEASLRRTAQHAARNRANFDSRVRRFCSLFRTRRWFSLEFIDWLERRRR